jgi:hypothetical protein
MTEYEDSKIIEINLNKENSLRNNYTDILEQLNIVIEAGYICTDDEKDLERRSMLINAYAPIVQKMLWEIVPEIVRLEEFYNDFHRDLEEDPV